MALRLVALVLSCAAAGGCAVGRDEVARVAAPAGGREAVLVETNGGATTSFGYEVHVVPRGGRPGEENQVARLYGAVRNDSAYGANLRWVGARELRVEYLRARSAELRRPRVRAAGEAVRVALDSGVADPGVPAGGMLWNLQRRP